MNLHWVRFKADLQDLSHSYVNLFVELFRKQSAFQHEITFVRLDNDPKKGRHIVFDKKDLAYWIGHVVAYLFGICLFAGISAIGAAIFNFT